MAKLRQLNSEEFRFLQEDTLVGRSSACGLRLASSDVSKEHAVLHWTGSSWDLRDLDSRNGTFVAGRRLRAGQKVGLEVGAELCFGASERWIVDSIEPPVLGASTVDAGERLTVSGHQLLAFTLGEQLVATVSRDYRGRWMLESGTEVRPVGDNEQIDLCGRQWLLNLPEHSATTDISSAARNILDAELRFVVEPDHPVWLSAELHGQVYDLKRRGHHHLTYGLAELRVADVARGVDPMEAGWTSHHKIQSLLDCTRNLVNVNVHRARKQLEDAGFMDAACIIERRAGSGKLRLGAAKIKIDTRGASSSSTS